MTTLSDCHQGAETPCGLCDECASNGTFDNNNAVFDYDKQLYILNGVEISDQEAFDKDWYFPCPRCERPSELERVDAHGEYCQCLNSACRHSYTVN